jgi:5-methylcytosine-specific restriction endonuclease McrA
MGLRSRRRPAINHYPMQSIMTVNYYLNALPSDHPLKSEADYPEKSIEQGLAFYRSPEWKECREDFLVYQKRVCAGCKLCLETNPDMLNVDHALPVRHFWSRRLSKDNLQILCRDCNELKGNKIVPDIRDIGYDTIQRRKAQRQEREISLIGSTWMAEYMELEIRFSMPFSSFVEKKIDAIIKGMQPDEINNLILAVALRYVGNKSATYSRVKALHNKKYKNSR